MRGSGSCQIATVRPQGWGVRSGVMEKKMEATRILGVYIGITENEMEITISGLGCKVRLRMKTGSPSNRSV